MHRRIQTGPPALGQQGRGEGHLHWANEGGEPPALWGTWSDGLVELEGSVGSCGGTLVHGFQGPAQQGAYRFRRAHLGIAGLLQAYDAQQYDTQLTALAAMVWSNSPVDT